MNKAFLFVVMLVSVSFVGCIEDSSDELSSEDTTSEESQGEDTTINPVGVDDGNNGPTVEFLGVNHPEMSLLAAMYDPDGFIKSFEFNGMNRSFGEYGAFDHEGYENDVFCGDHGTPIGNNASFSSAYECFPITNYIILDLCYDMLVANQTIGINVEDNDGNTASANYTLMRDDFYACEGYEIIPEVYVAIFVTKDSSVAPPGGYFLEVTTVNRPVVLEDFSFFLTDGSGSTYVGGNGFGEIAMQFWGGEEAGIDMNYNGGDEIFQSRATNISTDDGSEFPVKFSDNDQDGLLSSGDTFLVYGPDTGPAQDGWKLNIQYDITGDIVVTAQLRSPEEL